MSVHVWPSVETCARNISPWRVIRIHPGAAPLTTPPEALWPLVDRRYCTFAPCPGVTIANTCFDPVARDSRNITPALAQLLESRSERTRAVIVPSPTQGTNPYMNESAVPQTSEPCPNKPKIVWSDDPLALDATPPTCHGGNGSATTSAN